MKKVSEFLSNKKALNSIGGEKGLEDIIKANVRAGCETCGAATTSFLKNMDEYLDDVLDFASNYGDKNIIGFEKVISELKIVNQKGDPNYAMEGAAFMLDKIKRTPEITPNTVSRFDGHFENAVNEIDAICLNCRFDIELKNGNKYEFKSWGNSAIKTISSSDTFLKQHLSYLENITDFKQLNYEFDVKKFSDRNEIVNQFKKMYEKNTEKVFEVIWRNKNLRNSIFDMTSYPSNINDIQLKTIILSEYRIMISNADIRLFNFIKTN